MTGKCIETKQPIKRPVGMSAVSRGLSIVPGSRSNQRRDKNDGAESRFFAVPAGAFPVLDRSLPCSVAAGKLAQGHEKVSLFHATERQTGQKTTIFPVSFPVRRENPAGTEAPQFSNELRGR
jgi:hypothetical protein